MQPYIFPYIGYFQLINAVDKFIFYDDVNFIKKGWINRNRILLGGNDFSFAIPLTKVSQNININKTYIDIQLYAEWKKKFNQTLIYGYKKAPFFAQISSLVNEILNNDCLTISELAVESVVNISSYLDIKTEFVTSSERYENKNLKRQDRLLDICKVENANNYINALGGKELYKKEDFIANGVKLDFIKTLPIEYEQFRNEFIPWLSIIDVLMFNDVEKIKLMLNQFELL